MRAAALFVILLSACSGYDNLALLEVASIEPPEIEAGGTLRIHGRGFPLGRAPEIRLRGSVYRPGMRASSVDARLAGQVVSESLIEIPIAEELIENDYRCALYRGDMDKKERRKNLQDLRDGKLEVLISTDLGARGLDVENVDRVINYHLPKEMKNYLHRAGRTARAGRKGTVINFVTERDENLIKRLDSIG